MNEKEGRAGPGQSDTPARQSHRLHTLRSAAVSGEIMDTRLSLPFAALPFAALPFAALPFPALPFPLPVVAIAGGYD